MSREWRLSLALLVLLAGCGPDGDATAGDSAFPILAASPSAPGDTTCLPTGLWARCSVFKSLERAGLNTHADSAREVIEAPLSIPGIQIPIGGGDIRIFIYADSASRMRDAAKLDRKSFIRPVQEPGFKRERTIVESANLLVLMNVMRSLNRERISNALLAGAPQPPSRRP